MSETIDVEKLMQNVREQFERGSAWDQATPHASPRTAPDMAALARANRSMRFRRSLVGQIPPAPSTLRARASGVLVRMISKSLFWFTGRLDDFNSSVVEASDLQSAALSSLAWSGQQTRERLDRLSEQLKELSVALAAETTARERAEQRLNAAMAESAWKFRMLEASSRRLEIAVDQRQPRNQRGEPGTKPEILNSSLGSPTVAATRRWEIGICGTFDVSNYGDLLFPLIAEAELKRRLGDVTLHRFSYYSKTSPSWPYQVTPLAELPEMLPRLDGLLIGGGLLVRFDKDVAPGYAAPDLNIHHPTGYWLGPALMALQHNVPVAWNALGASGAGVPEWATPLLELALGLSPYIAVRDELSRAALQPLTRRPVELVPDTAFGLPHLVDVRAAPSAEFARIAKTYGLESPYIVFQPNLGFEPLLGMIRNHPERFDKFHFLMLPISPEFGEHSRGVDLDLPRVIRLEEWPHPAVIAELIGRAEAAIGHSLHFNISAIVAGVPVFRRVDLSTGKFTGLKDLETIFVLPPNGHVDADWFLARVGRKPPSRAALAALGALNDHWNRVAAVFQTKQPETAPMLGRFWHTLPGLLESNKAPQPGLHTGSIGKGRVSRRVINYEAIQNHRLEAVPYQWAMVDDLFDAEDGRRLTETYPCDHFKQVVGNDGEKAFEYEVRPLIGMNTDGPSFPEDLSDAWRDLAADLISDDYRAAMTALTGYDLSRAPMEVNVFHYGPGCSLGAHKDLPEKLVTHVLYFNRSWNRSDGGCLRILASQDLSDLVTEVLPVTGNSAVLVRSERSWHAVPRVVNESASSRRSVTVTFYLPGSVSTMWPPGDNTPLHTYWAADLQESRR